MLIIYSNIPIIMTVGCAKLNGQPPTAQQLYMFRMRTSVVILTGLQVIRSLKLYQSPLEVLIVLSDVLLQLPFQTFNWDLQFGILVQNLR